MKVNSGVGLYFPVYPGRADYLLCNIGGPLVRLDSFWYLLRQAGLAVIIKNILFIIFALLFLSCETVTANNGTLKLSAGAEYTTGDFGGTEAIDQWYLPVTARYIINDYVFRLTVPYIQVTAPEGSIVSGGTVLPGTGTRTTEMGLGDVIAGMTLRDVLVTEFRSDMALDFTAKVKFATADESRGLGTGENDYTFQAELYKFYSRYTAFGILGYKFRGDPPGYNLNDSLLFLAGANTRLSQKLKTGLDFYYQQASYTGLDDQMELSAFLGYRLSNNRYLRGYLIQGLSDNSPDWGAGVLLTLSY